jgi:beta-1,4-N-acetylglucosaminyltransferase
MSVFVTVGTTLFDDLIKEVDQDKVKDFLRGKGFTQIVCQIGQGKYVPSLPNFRTIPSVQQFIDDSDLVISHAGAGTILDVLRSSKKLIVVVNPLLMNNHQLEIAEALNKNRHLIMCSSPSELLESLQALQGFVPTPLPASNSDKFIKNMISLVSS